jgi:hypothetical protein
MWVSQRWTLVVAVVFACLATGCSNRDAELEKAVVGVWQLPQTDQLADGE